MTELICNEIFANFTLLLVSWLTSFPSSPKDQRGGSLLHELPLVFSKNEYRQLILTSTIWFAKNDSTDVHLYVCRLWKGSENLLGAFKIFELNIGVLSLGFLQSQIYSKSIYVYYKPTLYSFFFTKINSL